MSLKNEGKMDVEKKRKKLRDDVFLFKKPRKTIIETLDINGLPAEWLSRKNQPNDRAILYLHGGYYISGSPDTHRSLAARICKVSNSPVLSIDYRLAPENEFPASLEDSISAYSWILNHKKISPQNVVIAGDSAGGGLTLSTLIKLRDEKIALPAGGVCLSPWTDLALTGESVKTNAEIDIMITENEALQAAEYYLKDGDRKDPLASPLYANLEGLPPLFIQTGTAEVLLDDSTRFAEKAEKSGVNVELDLWEDMFHAFQIFGILLPESKKALEKIGIFIKKVMN
ncbi:MAG: alpha/beta hydrolase [Candidatus Heimdallarchaeaceae archaeon]